MSFLCIFHQKNKTMSVFIDAFIFPESHQVMKALRCALFFLISMATNANNLQKLYESFITGAFSI